MADKRRHWSRILGARRVHQEDFSCRFLKAGTSAYGTNLTCQLIRWMSVIGRKADTTRTCRYGPV